MFLSGQIIILLEILRGKTSQTCKNAARVEAPPTVKVLLGAMWNLIVIEELKLKM